MSYLDIPRVHFSGSFFSDPSTQNNDTSNFPPGAVASSDPRVNWNPTGRHWFFLKDCSVKLGFDPAGNAASSDPVVGGAVETTNNPMFGRLVDIDPDYQQASQLWGLEFKVSLKDGSGSFTGKLQTATLRDLWARRAPGGFAGGFSGVYQSVFKDVTFQNVSASPILTALSKATAVAIKFVVYAYDATPGTPDFTTGKIAGTMGPFGFADGEAGGTDLGIHFLQARRMQDKGSKAFGNAPFKLNPGKKKLTIDLGNCIPESAPAGARRAFGDMEAVIILPAPAKPVVLGKLDYTKAHYEQTAGIEEIKLTDAQVAQLKKNPLGIRVSSPSSALVMNEEPKGLYVDATEIAFRLNPGETASFSLVATEFGAPKTGLTMRLQLAAGAPASALTFPASVTVAGAGAPVQLTAGDPGNPRGAVDGQLYQVEYYSGPIAPSNLQGRVVVKVFDKFTPAALKASTMLPILAQYAQVYPSMKAALDLGDIAEVRKRAKDIENAISRDENDPRYMPVTRDLSRDKKAALKGWLQLGAP